MESTAPTTLIIPHTQDDSAGASRGISPMLGVGIGVVFVCLYLVMRIHRRRQIDPCELAFRSMTRKMGLTYRQVGLIRKDAAVMGLSSPVGIVLSADLTARALEKV